MLLEADTDSDGDGDGDTHRDALELGRGISCWLVADALDGVAATTPEALPERVGPYEVLRRLGRGGMGEVFLARQEQPIRREAALKVLRLGMDSDEVLRRFEQERQALALLDHPHIAKDPSEVLDLELALEKLTRTHECQARVVELRFFGGLSL